MSIIIINSRVFSAKNPTVNDASGVTMLFAEAGMIFGVPQNNNSVLHDSYIFMFKCKRIYGLNIMKSEFKKAGTLQLTGIRHIDGEL